MRPAKIIRSAYIFLFIAVLLGCVLRCLSYLDISPFNGAYLLQAHSHTAFLGWAFMLVFGFLTTETSGENNNKRHLYLSYAFLAATAGIVLSFTLTGYSSISIFFLAVHTIFTYLYGFIIFKEWRFDSLFAFTSYRSFLKAAYVFHLLSTLGVILLGVVMNTFGKQSVEYEHAIYFYLHFQYNGFLTFSVLGWVVKELCFEKYVLNELLMKRAFTLLVLSVLFTLYLSFLGHWHRAIYYLIGAVGVILQVAGFTYFIRAFVPSPSLQGRIYLKEFLYTALLCLLLKNMLQAFSAIPVFEDLVFQNRSFIIFYLHLVLLGVLTFSYLFLSLRYLTTRLTKTTIALLIAGFAGMQVCLFLNGFSVWYYGKGLPGYIPTLALFSLLFFLAMSVVLGKVMTLIK